MAFTQKRFWSVLWHGLRVAWTAAKIADQAGLPMGAHIHEGIRIASAVEDAAKRHRVKAQFAAAGR